MVKVEEFPEEGELVVGTVKTVKDWGAFVALDEYPGKEGFIHIAEVSSGWIKYIRDYVWEGQKVVCKVLRVNPERGHIDLSLKAVNEHQKRAKIQEWKNEFKAENLLKLVANRLGRTYEACLKEFAYDLVREYGTLYNAFMMASSSPDEFRREHEGEWVDTFLEIARENIVPPTVTISGLLSINCPRPDGVEHVKEALRRAMEGKDEDVEISVSYVGAPRYRLTVKAPDYKTAEECMKRSAERAIEYIKSAGGEGSFSRKG